MSSQTNRIILIALFGSAIIGLPIWDTMSPMQEGKKAIESQYGSQYALCVGASYSFTSRRTTAMRAYILFPDFFSDPTVVMVTQVNGREPTVSDSIALLIGVIVIYFNCGWAIRKYIQNRESQQQLPSVGDSP